MITCQWTPTKCNTSTPHVQFMSSHLTSNRVLDSIRNRARRTVVSQHSMRLSDADFMSYSCVTIRVLPFRHTKKPYTSLLSLFTAIYCQLHSLFSADAVLKLQFLFSRILTESFNTQRPHRPVRHPVLFSQTCLKLYRLRLCRPSFQLLLQPCTAHRANLHSYKRCSSVLQLNRHQLSSCQRVFRQGSKATRQQAHVRDPHVLHREKRVKRRNTVDTEESLSGLPPTGYLYNPPITTLSILLLPILGGRKRDAALVGVPSATRNSSRIESKSKTQILVFALSKNKRDDERHTRFTAPAVEGGALPAPSSVRLEASSSAAVGLFMCASHSALSH